MSEILLATNASNPEVIGSYKFDATAEEKARQLPQPKGYRILCAIPEVDKEYESGLVKAEQTIDFEEKLATVLFVVELGPDCYARSEEHTS